MRLRTKHCLRSINPDTRFTQGWFRSLQWIFTCLAWLWPKQGTQQAETILWYLRAQTKLWGMLCNIIIHMMNITMPVWWHDRRAIISKRFVYRARDMIRVRYMYTSLTRAVIAYTLQIWLDKNLRQTTSSNILSQIIWEGLVWTR